MHIEQTRWTESTGWERQSPGTLGATAQLVLVFGSRTTLLNETLLATVRSTYPCARLMGCSTAGEIYGTQVTDDSLSVTALQFEHSNIRDACAEIQTAEDSFRVGQELADQIPHRGLIHALIFSDGSEVNGTDLVAGLTRNLPPQVTVTGGLAGDADRFEKTFVLCGGHPARKCIALVGLYGERLQIGYGSLGGWDPFGPERLVTRAKRNILYELDGRSALSLYKKYLGDHAADLPAAALLFPLSLRTPEHPDGVVRTILAVNEREQSMTFAGDVPKGAYVRLMKANFDRLIDGAQDAAKTSYQAVNGTPPDLAILISCVGRKLILKQRIEEEVEAIRDILGDGTALTGFYSYGEISPFTPGARCELHNQTMTITTMSEK